MDDRAELESLLELVGDWSTKLADVHARLTRMIKRKRADPGPARSVRPLLESSPLGSREASLQPFSWCDPDHTSISDLAGLGPVLAARPHY